MRHILALFLLLFSVPAMAELINIRTTIVQYQPSSYNSPAGEQAPKAFDGSANSKYLNFDKQNMGVGVKLSTGRPVSAVGFVTANDSPGRDPMTFSLYGSNDGSNWTMIIEHTPTQVSSTRYAQSPITYLSNTTAYAYYYIRFPTMRSQYDNSIQIGEIQLLYESTATETSTATGSFGAYPAITEPPAVQPVTITPTQTTKINQTSSISTSGIYIENQGDSNSITIEQFSRENLIRGVDGAQRALISGSYNSITIYQGTATTPVGDNLLEMSLIGNSNQVGVTQQHNSKYMELKVDGGSNILDLQQKDSGGKSAFVNVQGDLNNISLLQQGSSQHFANINVLTSSNLVSLTQSGAGQKLFSLTINSPNVGVTVQQTNATTGDSATMSITCNTGPCNGYSYTKN
jgi:hypothetical protein